MPCLDGIIYFFLTIGVKLGDRIGVRNTVIISFGLFYLSFFILIFAKNFWLFLISMVMFGIGHAISNLAVIKNCWKYFPNNMGLVYGIIVSGAGMCSSIFTPLADFIVVNPEKETVNELGFYPKYIAMRLLKYLIIATLILSIFAVLAIFFTFDNNTKEEDKKDENKKEGLVESEKEDGLIKSGEDEGLVKSEEEKEIENKNENERESEPNFNALEDNENINKDINKSKNNKMLWEALLSSKNLMFVCFCFCSFCKYFIIYLNLYI